MFRAFGPVREALAQKDYDWEKWGLEELVETYARTLTETPYLRWLPRIKMSRNP